jgi:anti-sigma regulatory factor (Ser/Thr protein kinase)
MEATFQRDLAPDVNGLRRLLSELDDFLQPLRLPAKAVHDAQLVCDELIGNSIRHALAGRHAADHRVRVRVRVGDAISIEIRDDLPLFDPTSAPCADRRSAPSVDADGGFGLRLVRRAARAFTWRAEGGRNVTELQVEIAPSR